MSRIEVLLEIPRASNEPFAMFHSFSASSSESARFGNFLVEELAGFGVEVNDDPPVPMFPEDALGSFRLFSRENAAPEAASSTFIVSASVPVGRLEELSASVVVWPNSELVLLAERAFTETTLDERAEHLFDLARSSAGVDCRPFRPAVSIADIRQLLGVDFVWGEGFRGQNVIVGILDEGVDGTVYPVVGGFTRDNTAPPGSASIQSHGSMCAADVLVAAPAAKIYDYPFLGKPRSGGALTMLQAVLDQRRRDGTPHLTSNSYGFVGRPPQATNPRHEVWDPNHPVHRKVREVVASGAPTFFAAGNCGAPCPSGNCHPSGVGPGASIHASNSLAEVITVAAVNSRHERIGYSSQGPGGFEPGKPDVAAYSHFFGNFGPGRPAGGGEGSFDNGTSAACPVAAGVGALLLSAFPTVSPADLRQALVDSATNLGVPGWDEDTGHGVVNAAAAYSLLKQL